MKEFIMRHCLRFIWEKFYTYSDSVHTYLNCKFCGWIYFYCCDITCDKDVKIASVDIVKTLWPSHVVTSNISIFFRIHIIFCIGERPEWNFKVNPFIFIHFVNFQVKKQDETNLRVWKISWGVSQSADASKTQNISI